MTKENLHNRRAFLSAGVTDSSSDQDVSSDYSELDGTPLMPLTVFSQDAMGCEFQVFAAAGNSNAVANSIAEGFELVQKLENQMTVYRPTSEINQINRTAAGKSVQVEAGLFDLLSNSIEIYQLTDGTFDITLGPLTKLWGFYRRDGRMPPEQEIEDILCSVGSRFVQLDSDRRTIKFGLPGLEINLGGIGKGYALDQLCHFFDSNGITDYLIHGGQSSIIARGQRQQNSGNSIPWVTGITHPIRPATRLGELLLDDRAVGTSGSGRQRFVYQGKSYCHILDPRTGWPADKVLSTTVIAPTAAVADALATACFVLGFDGTRHVCQEISDVAAIVIGEDVSGHGLKIETFNLESDQFRLVT